LLRRGSSLGRHGDSRSDGTSQDLQKGSLLAGTMPQISPVAHCPWGRGVVRTRNGAALSATFCPPHPAPVRSGGRGVAALLLAMLEGPHALSKVGTRREARGMFPLRPPGLTCVALQDDRLGQRLEARWAAHRHGVLGAIALHALEVEALAPPWRPQATTTITL
jgi:hypothetical protein